jgi:hydroxyacylglutathione hydrolase
MFAQTTRADMLEVTPIPCLRDNYAYLVRCRVTDDAVVIDPSEAAPVVAAVERSHARLTAIWATHHHWDHVGGIAELVARRRDERADLPVLAHTSDLGRIEGATRGLKEGDRFHVGVVEGRVLHIPGHTLGAIAYVLEPQESAPIVFTGDTLFVAGCGRIFEGTAEMMHASLQKLASLPQGTRVYCGHEYTVANLRFAAHCEPENAAIARAAAEADTRRREGRPTVPSTIAGELETNPFLRANAAGIRRRFELGDSTDASVFARLRSMKDSFAG